MRSFWTAAAAVSMLSACSTTPADLETKASTQVETRTFVENYQEIYRRIATTAERCFDTGGTRVDAQLYSELGFGEVTLATAVMEFRNYFWRAKIARDGTGAKLTIYSGNTINNAMWLDKVRRWADGDEKC